MIRLGRTPRRPRTRAYATVALGDLAASALGAPARADEEPGLISELFETWRYCTFGVEDGLPHLRVRHVFEARDGTVWVGTDGGLCHYDGYRFVRALDLPQQPTSTLCERSDGTLGVSFLWPNEDVWIGGKSGFRMLPDPPELLAQGRQMYAIGVVADGDFVCHARGIHDRQGVFVLDPDGAPQLLACPEEFAERLHRLESSSGPDSASWAPLARGIREVTRDGTGRFWSYPSSARVHALLVDARRDFAVVGVHYPWQMRGVWEIGPNGPTPVPDVEGATVLAMAMSPAGEVLVALRASRGLHRDAAGRWRSIPHTPERMQEATALRFAANGDLWIGGTDGLALVRRGGARWQPWRHDAAGARDTVHAIEDDGAGGHWIGLGPGLEHRPAAGPSTLHRALCGVPLDTVTALERDARGRLWVGSGAGAFPGVFVHDAGLWRPIGAAEGLGARCVHQLRRAPDGRVAVLALPDFDGPTGIWLGDGATFEHLDPCRHVTAAPRYYDAAWTPDGALWIAFDAGLARLHGGETQVLGRAEGLRHPRVYALAVGPAGDLWFGHQASVKGLGRIDGQMRVTYLAPDDGSLEPNVTSLAFDGRGRLWIGSENGLLQLEGGLLQRVDRSNGLARSHVNVVSVHGDLLVVGTDGQGATALPLDPTATLPPRITFEAPVVDGLEATLRWRVASPYNEDPPHRLHVRQRLDGGPWSAWNHHGHAALDSLSHGTHQFEVEVASLLHRARAVTEFHVVSPLRESLWIVLPFSTLAIGALVVSFWSVARRLREAREHRETSERFEQLAGNVRDLFWLVDWRARRVLYVSPAFEVLFDMRRDELDSFGRNWRSQLHQDDREAVSRAYREGIERAGAWDQEFRVVRRDGRIGWIHARAFAIGAADGGVARVAGVAEEVTERREAEEHQARMSLELDHRVKNSLAQVMALAEQTLRATSDLARFRDAFFGRLRSLARTHEALAAGRWRGVALDVIVRRSVEGLVEPMRLVRSGPTVVLTARVSTALGLSLHELATNALKYGALRHDTGTVQVHWVQGPSGVVELVWRERGAAGVKDPGRAGLGTKLIRGMIEHELGGAVTFTYHDDGLECRVTIPQALRADDDPRGASGMAGMSTER